MHRPMGGNRVGRAAALVASLLALGGPLGASDASAAGTPVEQATEAQKAQAKVVFTKAKEAFNAKKYEEALAGFRAADDIVSSPNVRIMIAQALDGLGKDDEAYTMAASAEATARALAAADPKYTNTADAARKLVDGWRPELALLTVKTPDAVPPEATLKIGERDIPRDAWSQPIAVKPGVVLVVLSGHEPKEVTARAGQDATIDFAAVAVAAGPPAPAAAAPASPLPGEGEDEGKGSSGFAEARPIAAYTAGGLGLVGFVLFGVFGGLASANYSDIEAECTPDQQCPASLASEADTGRSYQTVANVSLVIGIVGVAAGAGLLVWDLLDTEEGGGESGNGTDGGDATARARSQLVVGPGSVVVRGSF
jgi:hypothetical protein